MSKFVHLHLHSEYSILDGTSKIPDIVERVKELGMDSCALTDHGNLYGALKFHKAMNDAGLKPIIGCELYIAPRRLDQKEAGIDNKMYHMTVLCKNQQGYKNLMKLVSIGNLEGYYYRPRVDIETLKKHSDGLIATSGCFNGMVMKEFRNSNPQQAYENAKLLSNIFKDRFYIEIQRNGYQENEDINPELIKLARELKIPMVAACDVHYLTKDDAIVQEVLWCIADGKTLDDPTRRQLESKEFYIKSPEEMEELFKDLPEALENTVKIAEEVESYDIRWGRIEPQYKGVPEGKTIKEHIKDLTYKGAKKKYGEITPELQNRLDFELEIIDDKGYNDYFLITREFVQFCRENDIVVGMRGSGCGSAVAYSLDITSIEPIEWELYFERFLNPERKSPPDFDLDIADARRDEVIQFTIDRYGKENVRQIGTFSKLQTRQAIRDVSRVLGIDLGVADKLSKMVLILFGKSKNIDYMIENDKEFADTVNSSPELQRMAELVRKVSGLTRGVSTHACGMVITPKPVDEYVALQRDSKNEGIGMTQFEFMELEEIGLMKFDFLGLRNLSVIGEAIEKVRDEADPEFDIFEIPADDKKAFELIQKGNTVGVFQLEGDGMKRTIKSLKPSTLEEVCYLLAAYRPGPMQFIPEYVDVKEGRKEAEYPIGELKPILGITNGVITYQEQVIRIAVDIAGYSMGGADILRKAMGKKIMEVMEKERPVFIEGAVKNGFDRQLIEELWDKLLKFADYGFNKAHSASYAMVSYWTAYLKANYPLEFMAALLESDLDNFDRVVVDLQDCERMGISVLPPNINKSAHKFTIEDGENIRFGLAGIKNVGEEEVKKVVEEREKDGEYKNLDDFIYRTLDSNVHKRTIEYLIKAGVFDSFGERGQLLEALPVLYDRYKKEKEKAKQGQFDLFGNGEVKKGVSNPLPLPQIDPVSVHEKLMWEKELLGFYVSSHPLDDLLDFLESKGAVPINTVEENGKSRDLIILGGIVNTVRRITTKKNESMAFISVEDKSGTIDMVVFPRVYEEHKEELQPNMPMLFAGRTNERNGELSFILEKAKVIDPSKFGKSDFEGVTFKVNGVHGESDIVELKTFIKEHSGDTPVRIIMSEGAEEHVVRLKHKIAVDDATKKMIERFS